MKRLCLFKKNSVGILLIRQDFSRAKNSKILILRFDHWYVIGDQMQHIFEKPKNILNLGDL